MDSIVFWLVRWIIVLGCAANLAILVTARHRLPPGALLFRKILTGFLLFWSVLQLAGGYTSPFFIVARPLREPLVALFWSGYLGTVWGVALWLVRGGNWANVMRHEAIGGRPIRPPSHLVIVLILSGIGMPLFAWWTQTAGLLSWLP